MLGVSLFVMLIAGAVGLRRSPVPRLDRSLPERGVDATSLDGRLLFAVGPMCGLILGSPVATVVGPFGVWFVRRERSRRAGRVAEAERADRVLELVSSTTTGLRGGRSLAESVVASSDVNERSSEVVDRLGAGRSFSAAVEEVLGSGSADERLIATTIGALEMTGASAFVALERVGEALGERRSAREEARTQAQQALSSAAVLAALPFAFGAIAAAVEGDVARLYLRTWVGAACVVVAMALVVASWEWMQRLLHSTS